MKKLFLSASTFGHLQQFHSTYLQYLNEKCFLHIAAAQVDPHFQYCAKAFDVPFQKRFLSFKNLSIIVRLTKILRAERYDVISVHTTLTAFIVRMAVLLSRQKVTVINTVHGYLFDPQSPWIKKFFLLSLERIVRSVTDVILVMNTRDYALAQKYKLYKSELLLVPGMGVPLQTMLRIEHDQVTRKDLGISNEDYVLLCVAEFSKRKNQQMLISALRNLPANVVLLFLGEGKELAQCKRLVENYNLNDRVFFAGYIQQPAAYYALADVCVSASRSEGLPFNIIEAMAFGLPILATKVKGHEDLVIPGKNGILFPFGDEVAFCTAVVELMHRTTEVYRQNNREDAQKYDLEKVFPEIIAIYKRYGLFS